MSPVNKSGEIDYPDPRPHHFEILDCSVGVLMTPAGSVRVPGHTIQWDAIADCEDLLRELDPYLRFVHDLVGFVVAAGRSAALDSCPALLLGHRAFERDQYILVINP